MASVTQRRRRQRIRSRCASPIKHMSQSTQSSMVFWSPRIMLSLSAKPLPRRSHPSRVSKLTSSWTSIQNTPSAQVVVFSWSTHQRLWSEALKHSLRKQQSMEQLSTKISSMSAMTYPPALSPSLISFKHLVPSYLMRQLPRRLL